MLYPVIEKRRKDAQLGGRRTRADTDVAVRTDGETIIIGRIVKNAKSARSHCVTDAAREQGVLMSASRSILQRQTGASIGISCQPQSIVVTGDSSDGQLLCRTVRANADISCGVIGVVIADG